MLKLASLAPELIALLAENTLDVEQCQALSLESDPARQIQVYEQVKASYSNAPAHLLKRAITDTEISVRDARFMFVGREAYEAAGAKCARTCSACRRATERQTGCWSGVWCRKNGVRRAGD